MLVMVSNLLRNSENGIGSPGPGELSERGISGANKVPMTSGRGRSRAVETSTNVGVNLLVYAAAMPAARGSTGPRGGSGRERGPWMRRSSESRREGKPDL